MDRVGEMGKTPHGKVNEEVATATGPGMRTTEHHRTSGISLVTLASSSQVNQKVGPDLVKPLPPPLLESKTLLLKWTPPHTIKSHRIGQVVITGKDDSNKVCQVHEHANDPVNSVDTAMDKTTARVTASTSMDAAHPTTIQPSSLRTKVTSPGARSVPCNQPIEPHDDAESTRV